MDTNPQDARAARQLAELALSKLGRTPDRRRRRARLRGLTGGLIGREQPGWPIEPELATPWQDTGSGERRSWRCRAAYLPKDEHEQQDAGVGVDVTDALPVFGQSFDSRFDLVFSVDYQVCRRCGLGWVEYPWTSPRYQRYGLAATGLAAIRADHPNMAWHTLGGHAPGSRPFWDAAGARVAGGYAQHPLCPHVTAG